MVRKWLVVFFVCALSSLAYGIDSHIGFEGAGTISVEASDDNSWAYFFGQGVFEADVWIADVGYGMMDTDVHAWAQPGYGGAAFKFEGWQNLFGYTNDRVVVNAAAWGNEEAFMNLRFDNSDYVVQLERHDIYAGPFLYANGTYGISYGMAIYDPDDDENTAWMSVGLFGNGEGELGASHWFPVATGVYPWGEPNVIVGPSSSYYKPYSYASAGGSGNFVLGLFGSNYLKFDGGALELPGGGEFNLNVEFFDGMEFNWDETIVK